MSHYNISSIEFIKKTVLLILSIAIAIYSGSNRICDGLELLFLLPLSYGISLFVFPKAHTYWKENVGFIILFVSIWIKYLATPVLMTLSHSTVNTLNPTVHSLRISSIIAVFELFITLFIVQYLWPKERNRRKEIVSREGTDDINIVHANFRLRWTGVIFLLGLLALVVLRGHLSGTISHLSTWFREATDTGDLYSYDLIAFEVIKSGVVLVCVSFFARKYYQTKSTLLKFIFFLLAFIFAVLNTYYFQYDQRTALTQLVLSTMFMFLSFFPSQKKLVVPVGVFFGVGLIAIVFLDGTMHYTIGGSVSNSFLAEMSKMSELYVSGPTVAAKTLDTISSVRSSFSIDTVWSDLIHSMNFLSMLPFTRWISNSVRSIPTSNDLFKYSIGGYAYILPNYTFSCYYVSIFFGWVLEIILILITIKLICLVERKKTMYNDALYFYAFTYFETILGQAIFVNNFRLLWHSFSKLPIWLLLFAIINSAGSRIKLKKIDNR